MPDQWISIANSNLQKLYDYWAQKRGARLAPKRGDMSPADLKYILPYMYIMDVTGPPYRFRFRLAGTDLVREYGGEITGKFADEIDLDLVGNLILDEYASVARNGQPMAAQWHYTRTTAVNWNTNI